MLSVLPADVMNHQRHVTRINQQQIQSLLSGNKVLQSFRSNLEELLPSSGSLKSCLLFVYRSEAEET